MPGPRRRRETLEGEGAHGVSVFCDDKLPWVPGVYEFRYHHDGKHNVLARSQPVEVYVGAPAEQYASAEQELAQTSEIIASIVRYSAPTTRPLRLSISQPAPAKRASALSSAGGVPEEAVDTAEAAAPLVPLAGSDGGDDFVIWDRKQAARISAAIRYAFGLELAPEVVVAEANVARLAHDVVEGRKLLRPAFQPMMS